MSYVGFVIGVSVVDMTVIMLLKDRAGLGNLNIPAGFERGTPNPKKPQSVSFDFLRNATLIPLRGS